MPAIALALASAELVAKLIPIIQKLHLGGTVTPEEQATVRTSYDAIVALGAAAFSAPEWQPSTVTGPDPLPLE